MFKFAREKKCEKGVTLVELLVAVAVFGMVMTVTSGIFIQSVKNHRKMVSKQDILDNARYTMEFMIKELRMAKADTANLDMTFNDGTGSTLKDGVFNAITFTNSAGHTIKYSYDSTNDQILRNDTYTDPDTLITTITGDQPISSDNVKVNALQFRINNWKLTDVPAGSGKAPLITLFVEVRKASSGSQQESINLQSTISPRLY